MGQYLVDEQNGFRRKQAYIDHIYSVSTIIRARIAESKSTFSCFIDFQKAFYWINRELLAFKLIEAGMDGKFYKTIQAMYSSTVASVEINSLFTDWFDSPFGVKQGDILSPTLFALFENDLALQIKDANLGVLLDGTKLGILLYADDIILLSESELQKM